MYIIRNYNLYFKSYVCGMDIKLRNTHRILSGTPEGNRPLRRCGRKWKNDINVEIKVRYEAH